jgi:hypothetical protein
MIYDIKIAVEINIFFREESVGSHMGIYAAGNDLDGELTLTISDKITCDKHRGNYCRLVRWGGTSKWHPFRGASAKHDLKMMRVTLLQDQVWVMG